MISRKRLREIRSYLDLRFQEEMNRRFGPKVDEGDGKILRVNRPFAFPSSTFYLPYMQVEMSQEEGSLVVYVSDPKTEHPMGNIRVWRMYGGAIYAQEIKTDEYGKARLSVPSNALNSLAVEVGGKTLKDIIEEAGRGDKK